MWGNQWILWDTHMCSIINGIADRSAKFEPALDSFKIKHLMRTSCMRHLTRFSACYSFHYCLSKYTVETSQTSSQATYTTSSNLTDIFVWTAHNWNWENVCELDRCYQPRQTGKIGTFPCCFQITHKFQCSFVIGLGLCWTRFRGPGARFTNVDRTWDSLQHGTASVQTGCTFLLFPSMT